MKGLSMSCFRPTNAPVRKCKTMASEGVKRGWGKPRVIWKEVFSKTYKFLDSIQT